jgi:uncharacterized protein (TIGR02145 family)
MNKIKFIFLTAGFLSAMVFTLSCSDEETLTDSRDGKVYKTVKIGKQIWMAENLNYDGSENKDKVVLALKDLSIPYKGDGKLGVCYDNDPANCEKYGRLYDWAEAMGSNYGGIHSSFNFSEKNLDDTEHKGICPKGWHLPSRSEWYELQDYAGKFTAEIEKKLKAKSGWKNNGTDDYGFSALPGGWRSCFSVFALDGDSVEKIECMEFSSLGKIGFWWSSTEPLLDLKAHYEYVQNEDEPFIHIEGDKVSFLSVRCVKNKK